jgi:hypothetical protein
MRARGVVLLPAGWKMGRLRKESEVFLLLGTSAAKSVLLLTPILDPPDFVLVLVLMDRNSANIGTLFWRPMLSKKLRFDPSQSSCAQDSANGAAMLPFSTKDACQKGSVRGFFPPSYVGP